MNAMILAICHRPDSERKCGDQRSMPRSFIVVSESATVMTNRDNRLIEIEEMHWDGSPIDRRRFGTLGVSRGICAKNRIKRILREDVFDIGDQQFLMLLFVMKTENEDRFDFIEQLFVRAWQADCLICESIDAR